MKAAEEYRERYKDISKIYYAKGESIPGSYERWYNESDVDEMINEARKDALKEAAKLITFNKNRIDVLNLIDELK